MIRSRATLVIACACVPGIATAEPEVSVQLAPSPGARAPLLEATVIGAPRAPVGAIALADGRGLVVPALAVRDYTQGPDTVAVALVVNGQEIWMGNDDIEPDDNARYVGVLNGLERGIDQLALAARLPAGSEGMVVSYATGADYRLRPAPIAMLTGAALGTQKDYRGRIGTDMVSGIELALSGLERTTATRRVLVVLGDGNDTNNEAAKPALVDLKRRAAQHHVETYAIIYKSPVSDEGNAITTMVPGAVTMNSIDGITAALSQIIERVTDRYYVTFDSAPLPRDGRPLDLALRVAGDDIATVTIDLPHVPARRPWWRSRWLEDLLIGVGLVGAVAVLVRWRVLGAAS